MVRQEKKHTRSKVLFVLPNLQGGGAERVFVHLLRSLNRDQFEPLLAVGALEGPYVQDLPGDVPIFELNAKRARTAIMPLVRLIWKIRPEIVFTTLGMCVAAAIARPILPPNTRLVMRLGNTVSAYLQDVENESKWKKKAYFLSTSLIYFGAHAVIAQSDFMVNDATEVLPIGKKKFHRIYNPVDVSHISELAALGKDLYAGPGPHLVSVGRLHWQKGFEILLNSISQVRNSYPNITLTILGDGELRADLESMAKKLELDSCVRFLGFVNNPYPYVKAADLFVLSSRYEGFANVLIESLALGTPVIATDCPGGNQELISNGINGWLAPVDDPVGLAKAISYGLSNINSIDFRKVIEGVSSRYGISKICAEYENVFQSLLPIRK